MSTTAHGLTRARSLTSVLVTALLGLTLAVNPMSAPNADAAVSARVGSTALHVAVHQVGVRYRWGGTSRRTGFDCSGLTQYSYARVGRHLPRTADQQYRATIRISRRAARPGDLVFFFSGRVADHVGIYAGHGYMYNASKKRGRVLKSKIWTTAARFGRVR
jgi:cell wall-associated NlpC family hydrolase